MNRYVVMRSKTCLKVVGRGGNDRDKTLDKVFFAGSVVEAASPSVAAEVYSRRNRLKRDRQIIYVGCEEIAVGGANNG